MRAIVLIIVGIVGLYVPWHNMAIAKSERQTSERRMGEKWRGDTALLPQYCQERAKGSQNPEWIKWRNKFGLQIAMHIHHYCNGIYSEQQAKLEMDQGKRSRALGNVIHQMNYVGSHCDTSCVLYPELHTRLGWALGEKGQVAEAIKHFQLAIQAKPTYSLAYARLSDLYVKTNQPAEARKVLEAGLKARPDSRSLQRRLKEL